MKICLIMAGAGKGGLESHFIGLSNELAKKDDVHVLIHPDMANEFESRVTVHPLNLQKSRNNLKVLFKLAKKIKDIDPDIVHAHANKAVTMLTRIRKFLAPGLKTIGTLHNKKKKLTDFNKLDFVIGVSNRVLTHVKNPNKQTIYNGVEIDAQKIRTKDYFDDILPANTPKDHTIILSLGRLVPAKRIDLTLKSFKGISDAVLVIAGIGPELENLKNLQHQLGLKNVFFIGHRTDNIELLSAADLCLITSDREGFNYVMLESLIMQTPVISTNVADMKLILPDRYVVDTGDEDQIRKIISWCLANQDVTRQDYQPIFDHARSKMTKATMVKKIRKTYDIITNCSKDKAVLKAQLKTNGQ